MPVRKPAGGVTAAELILPGGEDSLPVTLVEERSSYTEEALSDDGILRIRHTLTLVVPRTQATALLPLLPRMAQAGVTTRIRTAAGEELTAGWSERFGFEQPLRLSSFLLDSGTRRADGNHAVLRLESDDTTALQEI